MNIMICGTSSNVGKSVIVGALCRIFSNEGFKVSPFKSQNMSLCAVAVNGGEIGVAQAVQAKCARVEANTFMNPVLLKPQSKNKTEVILCGKSIGVMDAKEYFSYRKKLLPTIINCYKMLESENDIVVIEGAGSPSEINLNHNDIVNLGLAKMINAPVILVGDIDLGGVFASIYGTIKILSKEKQRLFKGIIINKFRGQRSLLENGLKIISKKTKLPVLAVVPYIDCNIEDEDSLCFSKKKDANTDCSLQNKLCFCVIKLPFISNWTDFFALENDSDCRVVYVETLFELKRIFSTIDMLILPGSHDTISDINWLKASGIFAFIKQEANNIVIMGICGGLQILGKYIVSDTKKVQAMGLLDCNTIFAHDKCVNQVQSKVPFLSGFWQCIQNEPFEGYEIHRGKGDTLLENLWTANGKILGTYIHGIFDNGNIKNAIKIALYKGTGKKSSIIRYGAFDTNSYKESQYDKIASVVKDELDLKTLYSIMQARIK